MTVELQVLRTYFRLPPERGGMEAHIEALSKAQRSLGIPVLNVYNVGTPSGPGIHVLKAFDLRRIKPASFRNMLFYGAVASAFSQMRSPRYQNVLHVHGDWSDFLFSKVIAPTVSARVVAATIHGTLRQDLAHLYRKSLSHCSLVFTTGRKEQQFLARTLGREVHHLPSAPDNIFFQDPVQLIGEPFDIVTVANFLPVKRLDLVVACAALRPHLRFAILGDGPDRRAIEDLARARGVRNLSMPGRMTPTQIRDALRQARLFLLTSLEEGTPTAALEALATGLPIVLTPSNEYDWLVKSGICAMVTKTWDPGELVAAIDSLMLGRQDSGRLSCVNMQVASQYRWTTSATRVTRLMEEAVQRNQP